MTPWKFRYVYKHPISGELRCVFLSLADIEAMKSAQIKRTSTYHTLLARDLWTGLLDQQGVEIYENDIVRGTHIDYFNRASQETEVSWVPRLLSSTTMCLILTLILVL